MKLMHLGDLHIGKNVNGFSMIEDQKHVLGEILEIVREEKPKAVLIAGDVYDRAVPGVEAVRLFDDFLTALAREAAVIVVAGNHDSPERIGYAGRLLADRNVYLCGAYEGKMTRVTLADEWGEIDFWLLPYLKPFAVKGYFEGKEIETYGDALEAALEREEIDFLRRNVLVAHQFFVAAGVIPERSESEINAVGGLDAIDAELVKGFDYVALGHLHGAQKVGAENIRYAGSPLKYSFSEWKQKKSVAIVEILKKGKAEVRLRLLTPLRDLREIRGTLEEILAENFMDASGREDYLRVVLTDEDELIDPMGKLRGLYPNVMSLEFKNTRTEIDLASIQAGMERTESPIELFSEFFLETTGGVMSAEQAEAVRLLMEGGDGE